MKLKFKKAFLHLLTITALVSMLALPMEVSANNNKNIDSNTVPAVNISNQSKKAAKEAKEAKKKANREKKLLHEQKKASKSKS
jgi:uncharacterized membrane protein